MGTTRTPAVLAAAAVLAQVAYPLLDGRPLRVATVVAVALFFAACVTHAGSTRGAGWAAGLVVVAGGTGLVAEAVGVRTGVPFGAYSYTGTLGPQLLGVPVVVPMAWVMMAYPCLLLGRTLAPPQPGAARSLAVAVLGGLTLAAWDLFLDPQMVAAGHWSWSHPEPALPGVPGIPLTNYAGWVLVAVTMVALLHRLLHDGQAGTEQQGGTDGRQPGAARWFPDAVPAALLAWTWLGSTLGNLVFFGRPWVALYGGVAMGVLVVPYLRRAGARHRSPAAVR